VKELITSVPFEKVVDSPYGLPDLLCRLVHNGYHIGQITKVREVFDKLDDAINR
jgi:hypothetical protein